MLSLNAGIKNILTTYEENLTTGIASVIFFSDYVHAYPGTIQSFPANIIGSRGFADFYMRTI